MCVAAKRCMFAVALVYRRRLRDPGAFFKISPGEAPFFFPFSAARRYFYRSRHLCRLLFRKSVLLFWAALSTPWPPRRLRPVPFLDAPGHCAARGAPGTGLKARQEVHPSAPS